MCGVFNISNLIKYNLAERFGYDSSDGIIPHEFQSAFRPTTQVPTVSRNSPNKLVFRRWGLVPSWVRSLDEMKFTTFNARSEEVREKPTYRYAWRQANRCLFIATEFWEFHKVYDGKKLIKNEPIKFSLPDNQPFAMAGLYQEWQGLETATMLTCEPSHDVAKWHDRMPCILAPEDEEKWLSKDTPLDEAYALLAPYPDGELVASHEAPPKVVKK